MRKAGVKVLTNQCEALRWKGMFIDADDDPTVPNSNTRIYWCVYTQSPLGPDSEVADEETCTASRSCYEKL